MRRPTSLHVREERSIAQLAPETGGREAYARVVVGSPHAEEDMRRTIGAIGLSRSTRAAEVLVGSGGHEAAIEVVLLREGRGEGLFGAERVSLQPGDTIVIALQRRFTLGFSDSRRLSMRLPAAGTPVQIRPQHFHGLVLTGGSRCGAAVTDLAEALWDTDEEASKETAAAVRFLMEILFIANADRVDRTRDGEDGAIVERVRSVLERLVANPDLTPSRLAAEAAVSRATLYRAFAPFGGVSAYIRDFRLRRSLAILGLTGLRVATVGFAHGFRSEAQFSRAFKTRFGLLPSQVRSRRMPPSSSQGRLVRQIAPPVASGETSHVMVEMGRVEDAMADVLVATRRDRE